MTPANGGRRQRRWWFLAFALAVVLLLMVWRPLAVRVALRTCSLAAVWAPLIVRSSPQATVAAFEKSGPVFIKLAQWLSTRRDLLSVELCDGMAELHERVNLPSMPADARSAERVVPGLKMGALLGGGSIAQVFEGQLEQKSGTMRVAVKVRRTGVDSLLDTDMAILSTAARIMEFVRPQLQWLSMGSAVENFRGYMEQQVNLTIEAANLRRLAKNFGPVREVEVPEVYFSTDRIMVTSVAEGVSLSEFVRMKKTERVREAVFEALTDLMARMILKDHFIHGDLHPGNVFISVPEPPGRVVRPVITLIDAGISIQMEESLQEMARKSMLAALNRDAPALGAAVIKLHKAEGLCDYARKVDKLAEDLGYLLMAGCFMSDEATWSRHFETYEEYRGSRVSEYFVKMLELLSNHRVRVSPSLWALMTAFALIEGSVAELGFGVNVLRSAAPYIFSRWDFLGRFRLSNRASESEKEHRDGK